MPLFAFSSMPAGSINSHGARCELSTLLAERDKVDEAEWHLQLCQEASGGEPADPALLQQLAEARKAVDEARTRPVADPAPAPRRERPAPEPSSQESIPPESTPPDK